MTFISNKGPWVLLPIYSSALFLVPNLYSTFFRVVSVIVRVLRLGFALEWHCHPVPYVQSFLVLKMMKYYAMIQHSMMSMVDLVTIEGNNDMMVRDICQF